VFTNGIWVPRVTFISVNAGSRGILIPGGKRCSNSWRIGDGERPKLNAKVAGEEGDLSRSELHRREIVVRHFRRELDELEMVGKARSKKKAAECPRVTARLESTPGSGRYVSLNYRRKPIRSRARGET